VIFSNSFTQSELVTGGVMALGYLTLSGLIVAAAIGSVYFGRLQEAADMQREFDVLQRQLIEMLLYICTPLLAE